MKEPSRVGWSARGTVARTVGAGIVNAAGRGLSRPGTGRQGRRNRVVTAGNPSLLTSHHVTSECAFLRGSSLDPPEHEPCQSKRISGGGAWADPILCRSPHLSRRGGWPARRFRQCAVPSGRQHRGDAAHCDVSRRGQSGNPRRVAGRGTAGQGRPTNPQLGISPGSAGLAGTSRTHASA